MTVYVIQDAARGIVDVTETMVGAQGVCHLNEPESDNWIIAPVVVKTDSYIIDKMIIGV